MFETFIIIVAVAVVLMAALLVFAATRPAIFRVQRSTSINAPPERIFPLINDLHSHQTWSPWEKKDPAMKRSYGGATSGKGAVYEWDGNRNIGKGRMEITEASPPTWVAFKLDFLWPFKANNFAEFTLEPQAGSTNVTWALYGPNLYISKLMGLFCSMDSMIGKEFETGLADLKTVAEKGGRV